jgi:hypothetical protein
VRTGARSALTGLLCGGIALAIPFRWAALALYVAVALMWLIPDPRIETFHRRSATEAEPERGA